MQRQQGDKNYGTKKFEALTRKKLHTVTDPKSKQIPKHHAESLFASNPLNTLNNYKSC